jgi:hypothetical protein
LKEYKALLELFFIYERSINKVEGISKEEKETQICILVLKYKKKSIVWNMKKKVQKRMQIGIYRKII